MSGSGYDGDLCSLNRSTLKQLGAQVTPSLRIRPAGSGRENGVGLTQGSSVSHGFWGLELRLVGCATRVSDSRGIDALAPSDMYVV